MQVKAQMDLIKKMGFNTVRIVGSGELWSDDNSGNLYVPCNIKNIKDTSFLFTRNSIVIKNYFLALDKFFNS